ncbi:hypothetical protein HPB51_019628 [Rhipicephalus microplus]|uniref:M13 family peptidase n=1 Tax=Rhipicephalus microplus TaxID=6941 RepID=A0A9J6F8E4_RHIMP|nr:hypothetical protein HPB51_019628 [Rhipicephalus microplus]
MKRTQVIIIVAVTTLFIACASLLTFLVWAFTRPTIQFCNTPDCLRHILELQKAMNTSVNPCEDFYKFTCGSWKPNNNEKSMVARIFEQSTTDAIEEMEEGSREKAVVPKAPDYYRSCIHRREMTARRGRSVHRLQASARFILAGEAASGHRRSAAVAEYDYNVEHQPPLPPQGASCLQTKAADTVYQARIHCRVLGVEAPSSSSIQELKNTVEDIINAALKVPPDATSDTQFTLKEIAFLMPNRANDWLKHLNILHRPQFRWTLDSPVALEDDAILQNLNALQQKYKNKKETLLEGFAFVFVRTTLWLFAGKPEMRYGTDPEANRNFWKRACLSYTTANFGLLVAVQHIYSRYTPSVRADLKRFHHTIQEALKQQIQDAAWIDEIVKNRATVKIDELSLNAMPDESFFTDTDLARLYRDFPTIGSSFLSNYIAVAAAYRLLIGHDSFISVYSKQLGGGAPSRYNYYYNIAYMSLGAMEPPILYLDGTMAMTYGTFGTLIAECLVRSFDKRGVLVNDLGRREHWWDSPAYTERVSCDFLSEPKTGGSDNGVRSTPPPGSRDPREVRFAALFPLAPALTTSFIAHRKAIATDGYVQRRLHGLDDFDDDQIFFLSYCLSTCAVNSNGETCNVPLRQMEQFATAFLCELDTPMNPQKKCTFFG